MADLKAYTTTYNFPYPLAGDSVQNTYSRIEELAQRIEETYTILGINLDGSAQLVQAGDALVDGDIQGNWPTFDIRSDVIETAMIKNRQVTGNKIDEETITEINLADAAVTSAKLDVVSLKDGSTAVTQPQSDNSTKVATTAYVDAYIAGTVPAGSIDTNELADGAVTNAKVNAAAGIAYSKLDLLGSIVNADIATGAAISYSKLSLANSILESDLAFSIATQGELDAHTGASTSVHGISDTANLVYTSDSRLSDARTPVAHATSHEYGGSDELELSPAQITGTAIVEGDTRLTDNRDPNAHAGTHDIAGSDPITIDPSQVSGTAVITSDSRLSDARTPTPHNGSHELGGSDELLLSASQISGTAVLDNDPRLTDARTPTAHANTHELGGVDEIEIAATQVTGTAIVEGDSRLTDARTPTTHASTHIPGGSDAIDLTKIVGLAASLPTLPDSLYPAGALIGIGTSEPYLLHRSTGSVWEQVGGAGGGGGIAPGAIVWFASTGTTPTGYLACDGASYLVTNYQELFNVIGYTYGGSGSSFNVPTISATTGGYYICFTASNINTVTTSLLSAQVGTMIDWPVASSYPTGFLRADGSNVSRTTYSDLFAVISTTYGIGDGSTTFTLPNLPAAGVGSPVKIIKAIESGIVEPSTVAHAASHTEGGSDVITITGNQIANYQSNRNILINGSMVVWQRGSASTANTGYWADRWSAYSTSSQARSTNVPTGAGFQYSLEFTRSGAADNGIFQRIEGQNCYHLSGKTVTLSFWAQSGSGSGALNVKFYYANALDDWSSSTLIGSVQATASISGSWTRHTVSIALPSSVTNGLQVSIERAADITTITRVTGVQLEVGSVATPFEFEPFNTTFSKCQRYFCKSTPITQTNFTTLSSDSNMNSGAWWCVSGANGGGVRVPFPVEMRTVPTVDFTAWTSTNTNVANGGAMTMHAPGLGDVGGVLQYKSQTGLSIYTTTTTSYRLLFFWRANAEL